MCYRDFNKKRVMNTASSWLWISFIVLLLGPSLSSKFSPIGFQHKFHEGYKNRSPQKEWKIPFFISPTEYLRTMDLRPVYIYLVWSPEGSDFYGARQLKRRPTRGFQFRSIRNLNLKFGR